MVGFSSLSALSECGTWDKYPATSPAQKAAGEIARKLVVAEKRQALLVKVAGLVDAHAKDDLAHAARSKAAHPADRDWLGVGVPRVAGLEDGRHGAHDEPGHDGQQHAHALRVFKLVQVHLVVQHVANALEAVDVDDARGDLDVHRGEERGSRLAGDGRVDERVHRAAVKGLARGRARDGGAGQGLGRQLLALLHKEWRVMALAALCIRTCALRERGDDAQGKVKVTLEHIQKGLGLDLEGGARASWL